MESINSDKINEYLKENIENIYKKIKEAEERNKEKEENFRTEMVIILHEIFQKMGIQENTISEQEYTVYKGRIDSLYGNMIIEYKAPGKIKADIKNATNDKYIEQVKTQITGLSKKNNIDKGKILGTIFDGRTIIYIKYRNEQWEISNTIKATKEAIEIFLKRLLSLSIDQKALTIENLLKDFSSESKTTKKVVKTLYEKYTNNEKYPKVTLLFEQWKQLYREICGYDFNTLNREIKGLQKVYEIPGTMKIEYIIFSIHTYFALIIKFLTIEVLTYISNKKIKGLNTLHIEDEEELKNELIEMEEGGIYQKLGITNFLEGDFFGGYLYFWDKEIYEIMKELIEIFRNYDYSSIHLEKENAKDLLKNVYHNLFPRELRHNLGEYYTPDWLAEFLIEEMKIDYKSSKTILDPTCGSGTFIVILIKKIIESNQAELAPKDLLQKILKTVKGYDLNPLAVISARANYIISLGELINEREEKIEIPIYLCDSMLTVLEQKKNNRNCYIVSTKAGNFPIPKTIVEQEKINEMLTYLNKSIKRKDTYTEFIKQLQKILTQKNIQEEEIILKELYGMMYELEQKGLDGIWGNVIKNSFAPIFQKKVDYIIGNPPWIVWQRLPEDYRNSIQKYWKDYKIFEHKGITARLGSSHDDLSVLMTYVIMDNFLKDKGKLGFVINQNIFQSSGGGQGFRKFLIKGETPIKIEKVDDFVRVQPFKDLDADNKTAIFTAIKNEETTYPVQYNIWEKKSKGKVYANETIENVLKNKIKKQELIAKPIKGKNTAWIIGNKENLEKFDKMIAKQKGAYTARKGVDTSANGIYWIKVKEKIQDKIIFDNSPETSKKEIKQVNNDVIEQELVYPLLRGKDITKWKVKCPYSIIIPYDSKGKVIPKEKLKMQYENAYQYFYSDKNKFIDILKNRGIVKKHYKGIEIPEYVLYDIGEYTFSPYKVVWKAIASGIISAVVTNQENKIIIPDHNVVMIPTYEEDEAYYISGILNSKIVTDFVNAYISWFFSTHILEYMNIPKYDKNNALHKKISKLSKIAHKYVQEGEDVENIEKELNEIVENLLIQED